MKRRPQNKGVLFPGTHHCLTRRAPLYPSGPKVERPSFSVDCLRRDMSDSRMNGLPPKDLKARQEPMLTCELCGKVDFAYIFKRSKRFCSTLCAKRYNVGCTKRIGLFSNRKSTVEDTKKQKGLNENPQNSSLELEDKTSSCVRKSAGHVTHPAQGESSQCSDLSSNKQDRWGPRAQGTEVPRDPGQWNVDDVYVFICSLPGCLEIAEGFRSQEIDGQALLLLKEDHLVGAMNIKLGPALKIAAQIGMLKDL
ncbi:polyhomeotic-like protein 2 isoform X2 [Hippocampus zosterae]|uniref:polyhomeotic-like protein 2 isoform X2 n=1 Tax=Hippocampus zosterae TaxID=109293 RepID=UPI00223CA846|nr:polyhomeotic-like protein 2 isoform X2 [Hippocampus zosterae]